MAEKMTMNSSDRVDAPGSFPTSIDPKDNIHARQIIGEGNDNPPLVESGSRHPVTSLSLPAEILVLILQPRWKPCEDRKTWKKIVNVLLRSSLVSRAWYEAARAVLYQHIRLSRINSLRLLLCTVREKFGGHCPAHTLQFVHLWPESKEYATLAGEIVACCPELRYLAGEYYGSLCFTSNMSLPEYPYLRELKVSGQNLHLLAPLLSRLCNLESFEMLQSRNGDDLLEHFLPPRFKLSTLSIFQTKLSPGLCKWLESSLQSIECLVVQDVLDTSLGQLAKVIGGSVKEVHVKMRVATTTYSDSEAISALSGFAGLRRLRVDGSKIAKECLLDLQSSLETFTFSEDITSLRTVLTLLHANWQPSLQSLNVYYMSTNIYPDGWFAVDVKYRDELQSICAARGIQLNWLSPEE